MSYPREKLAEYAYAHAEEGIEVDVVATDADIITYLLENCTITMPERNRFFGEVNCDDIMRAVSARRNHVYSSAISAHDLPREMRTLAYTGWHDMSHTSTVWEDVMALGLVGLRDRVLSYSQKNTDATKQGFYDALVRVWNAAIDFVGRAADEAQAAGKTEMSAGLRALTKHAPETLFEAMQTIVVYYVLQVMFDGTYLRTLGRLDKLFYPFFLLISSLLFIYVIPERKGAK